MAFEYLTIEYERGLLAKEDIPEADKKAILDFVDGDLILENIKEKRRMNYIQRLRIVARWIPDTFINPSKEDIRKVLLKLNEGYSEWTKVTYLRMIKKFYRKRLPKRKYETLFDDVKIKQPKSRVQQSDLITPDEMTGIINNCFNVRDKAIFSTLYDSGCRIGELLLMKIRNVRFDDYGAVIDVPFEGKTGTRPVRIVGDSIAYLRAWIDDHPKHGDLNAPLFCNISEGITGRAMTYDDVHSALKKILKRAGITRRIHPHLFRHTRATILASKVAEAPLEAQMGWVPGTKQMATYVHLSGTQTDHAILSAYGIKIKDESINEPKPVKCPRCGELNPSDAKYCRKCWLPLTVEEALAQKEKEDKALNILGNMELDPVERKLMEMIQNNPDLKDQLLLEILKMRKQKEKS